MIKEKLEVEDENSKLKEKIEELNNHISKAEENSKAISSALEQVKASNNANALKADNELTIENQMLKSQLASYQKGKKEAERKLAEVTTELDIIRAMGKSDENERIAHLEEKLKEYEEAGKEQSAKLTEQMQMYNTVKQQLISATEKLNASKEENIELQKKLKTESTRLSEKYSQKLNEVKAKLGNELALAKAKNIEYEAKLSNAINSGDIITVKETPEETLREVNDLRKTVLRFDKENQKLTQENEELKSAICQQRIPSNSEEINCYIKKINRLQLKITRLQSQLEKEKEKNLSSKDADLYEQKYLDAAAEVSTLQHEKNELVSLVEKMKAKAKFHKQAQIQENNEQVERLKVLAIKLDESNKTIQALQAENSKLSEQSKKNIIKLSQLEADNAQLVTTTEKLKSRISESQHSSFNANDEGDNIFLTQQSTTSVNSDESSEYKKALRLIGKMWLLQQNEPSHI